jgi:2-keto-4-pentenoate hydratase/2-oxohepta-3-ene-1,7-dioic acid hydratase in catechol pathway
MTLGNEGTIRDWVRHAKFNVTQGKNWEGSGAFGPHLVTMDEIDVDFESLELSTRVNGELRQQDTPATMKYPLDYQISYLSTFNELQPGDVIFTGTPTGAGARLDPPVWLEPGDVVEVNVPQLGTLVKPTSSPTAAASHRHHRYDRAQQRGDTGRTPAVRAVAADGAAPGQRSGCAVLPTDAFQP